MAQRCEHQPTWQLYLPVQSGASFFTLAACKQVFRSIDTESCVGFPTTNAEAYDRGLISSALPCSDIVRACWQGLKDSSLLTLR